MKEGWATEGEVGIKNIKWINSDHEWLSEGAVVEKKERGTSSYMASPAFIATPHHDEE